MPDMHHVAILHDVVFAFQPQRSFGSRVGFGASLEELIPADRLSANKMFFQIGMNRARRFLRTRVCRNLPGAALIFRPQ
jgi:hypothetical protein